MASKAPEQGLFFPGSDAAAEAGRRSASPNPGMDVPVEVKRGFWSRRTVLRFAGWGTLLALVGQWSAGFGIFFWPKKVGAFGGEVNAGEIAAMNVGDVKLIQNGKCYVSRVPEGVLALWWKCPHLGCTVPWKPDDRTEDELASNGRFNCPCHGSIYDRYATSWLGQPRARWICSACRSAKARSTSTPIQPRSNSALLSTVRQTRPRFRVVGGGFLACK